MMISAFHCSARSTEAAVFPTAVGPKRTTTDRAAFDSRLPSAKRIEVLECDDLSVKLPALTGASSRKGSFILYDMIWIVPLEPALTGASRGTRAGQ